MNNVFKNAFLGFSRQEAEQQAAEDYQISRSLRFYYDDSAYLSRTPGTAGNRKTWTWSGWAKRGPRFAGTNMIFSVGNATSNRLWFSFDPSEQLFIRNTVSSTNSDLVTTAVFRDPSAWYHIVLAFDTTQVTDTNRTKLYVNGVEQSLTGTYVVQDLDTQVNNSATAHAIGTDAWGAGILNYDGYLADINFIDGQALTPSSFGETDAITGVWKPKAYAGTYGTNGFHLDFSDNTSTTTLGYDAAGSNDWTTTNFSVAVGADNDSLVDTPTPYGTDTGAGGEVRGNYCTLNPLTSTLGGGSGTASNGNLAWIGTGGNDNIAGTMSASSGKFYYEVTIVAEPTRVVAGWSTTEATTHYTTAALFFYESACIRSGTKTSVWDVDVTTGLTFSNGDVIGFAIDIDGGELKVYQNNSLVSTITLPTDKGDEWIPCIGDSSATDGSVIVNFGQRPFAYTAPSGFKALCTTSLPTPTVADGGNYFNTVLFTGNYPTGQSITGVGFAPDLVWFKSRSVVSSHNLVDAVRGAFRLRSNTTDAESSATVTLDSDGFTVGSQSESNDGSMVAWNWNAGGSNATNTDGTITSTVRANPTAGFSIVTFTAPATNLLVFTVGHGLGAIPKFIITKERDGTIGWVSYHASVNTINNYILLNSTAGVSGVVTESWGAALPTSSVFGMKTGVSVNTSKSTLAYVFAEVEGYSKFGSYTGNGSTDGPFIYCGFRPAFFLIKRTDSTGNWQLFDSKRNGYNLVQPVIFVNANAAEAADTNRQLDFVSNGIKFRQGAPVTAEFNSSGATYIFIAFAENPFKYSLAR